MNIRALMEALGTRDLEVRGGLQWVLLADVPVNPDLEPQWRTLDDLTTAQRAAYDAAVAAQASAAVSALVNAERDRRIASGFQFAGQIFDSRPEDQKRINGAASLALTALTLNGAVPGDLFWHGGADPFGWIAQDNSIVQMDALTVIAFGQAAASWESGHIFAARALKELPSLPADFATNAAYWPATGV